MEMLGVVEPREDGVVLRGCADSVDWLARELARLPFDFAVHEPEQLRDALRKRALELTNLAGAQ
jgi:predicted DNA-binding transcriptional regulator YafY